MNFKGITLLAATVFGLMGCASAAVPVSGAVDVSTPVSKLLEDLRARSTPTQFEVFAQAVHASPTLSSQLDSLVKVGQLTRITIGGPATAGWGAWRDGSNWVFTPEFVSTLAPHRLFDVVQKDDILPSNMAFALGYMAWKASHEEQLQVSLQANRLSSIPGNVDSMRRDVNLRLRDDACAFIEGWNDVTDAAVKQNRDAPLTPMQNLSLMMNLVFREPFLMEARASSAEKIPQDQLQSDLPSVRELKSLPPSSQYHLNIGPKGIPMDSANIDAMEKSLGHSRMIPIRP